MKAACGRLHFTRGRAHDILVLGLLADEYAARQHGTDEAEER